MKLLTDRFASEIMRVVRARAPEAFTVPASSLGDANVRSGTATATEAVVGLSSLRRELGKHRHGQTSPAQGDAATR